MAFLVSTTGTKQSIVLKDLGGRTLTHPVVDLDLENEFTQNQIVDSKSIKNALSAGEITIKNEDGISITEIEESISTEVDSSVDTAINQSLDVDGGSFFDTYTNTRDFDGGSFV